MTNTTNHNYNFDYTQNQQHSVQELEDIVDTLNIFGYNVRQDDLENWNDDD